MRQYLPFVRMVLVCTFLGLLSQPLQAQNGSKRFSLKEICNWEFTGRSAGASFRSMEDGHHYTTLNSQSNTIVQYQFATGKKVATLFDLKNVILPQGVEAPKRIEDYVISANGKHLLIICNRERIYRRSWRAEVYHYDLQKKVLEPLSAQYHKVMIPTFSPDGSKVAFVRENNIFIHDLTHHNELQVTTDGKRNEIINGATDWVYEEELYCTQLLSWSLDGKNLAFVRFDERDVPAYSMTHYSDYLYPKSYVYKYPKAGEKNASVSVHIYNLEQQQVHNIALPTQDELYIPRIAFTPIKNQLAVMTLNRHQNHFRLYLVDPTSRIAQETLQEKDDAYIKVEWVNNLAIDAKGFVMVSEADGYAHIYRYNTQGKRVKKLTEGNYDVIDLYGVDKEGYVYYQAAEPSPIYRRIVKVSPQGETTVLTPRLGVNSATFTKDFSYFLNEYSATEIPPQYTICSSKQGKVLRTLEENKDLAKRLSQYHYSPKEFIKLEIEPGVELNGWMIKPTDFDPTKKYPLLMVQYSGPDSQEVLDRYDLPWSYALAQEGYIVACVDGRGTGGRGSQWRKCTYLKLGIQESDDQIAAARAFGKMSYIDKERIGIWGWSFGGYMTLLSLCRSEHVFKAGVAIAPVTDWRFYDTIYTERYLRTPQENPEGYSLGAPLNLASQIKDKMLIIHGSNDDNVHMQNSMQFIERLVQSDIPFEMAIYTDKSHSIYGGNTRNHLFSKVVDFLKSNL